jgi:hypothetical protein
MQRSSPHLQFEQYLHGYNTEPPSNASPELIAACFGPPLPALPPYKHWFLQTGTALHETSPEWAFLSG